VEGSTDKPVINLLGIVAKGHVRRINLLFTRFAIRNARFFAGLTALFTQQHEPRVGARSIKRELFKCHRHWY
jgi:hypothetical protein